MHGRTLSGGKQPGRQEERPPALGVERATSPVGVPQGGIVDTRGVEFGTDHRFTTCDLLRRTGAPVIRSAANRPDSNAVGTPTPGTVEEPANTTLAIPRTVLAGRNGPV